MKRVLVATVTTALLGFAPLTLSGPAQAEAGQTTASTSAAPQAASVEAQAMRTRKLTFNGNRQGSSNRFFVAGRVSPNYKNKVVLIRQANGANSTNFKAYKRIKTNGQGKFRTRVAIPQRSGGALRYIALVPKSGNFKAARSKRVYTISRA